MQITTKYFFSDIHRNIGYLSACTVKEISIAHAAYRKRKSTA
jgi:hypothetical protein